MLPYGRKNPLPFPYSLSSANFAVPSQGKGVIHKRVENRRLSTLLCARAASAQIPRRGARHIPAVRRRRIFSLNLSEKPPALKEANTLTQFEYPAQPVLKKNCRPDRT